MKPDWQTEDGAVQLYLGDCLSILPHLSGVDAVVTDPPYGEKTHAGARSFVATGQAAMKGFAEEATRKQVTFESITEEQFIEYANQLVSVSRRWVVLTCDWRHASAVEKQLPNSFVRCGVWVKPDSAPQFTGDRPGTGWEAVCILHRPGRKRWNGGGHHAVWTHLQNRHGEHPTQKPLGLVAEWVELFSDTNETVADPFMGSGTTGVACVRLCRRFIGIEKEKKYFDIAVKRITDELNRAPLFDTPPQIQRSFLEESA